MAKPMNPPASQESTATPFQLHRVGVVMEPEPGNPLEAEGVLNPASARGRDGQLYLFPRLVSSGNYSRIGIARVLFNEVGDPVGVERMGIALEPVADYEMRPGGGGCEDPRITFIEPLDRYVMTYTALSVRGPRIALAMSEDLFHWERLGLAIFMPYEGVDFNDVNNKDAALFKKHPDMVRYRSPAPVLKPELPGELEGVVPGVVFPTAIDRRDDLGLPNRFDIYYGMADNRIGFARLDWEGDINSPIFQNSSGFPPSLGIYQATAEKASGGTVLKNSFI